MKHSDERILTSHTGSLPRPPKLTEMVYARQEGKPVDEAEFHAEVSAAISDAVRKQRQSGIDVVSDGEMNKPGFVNYVGERLTGFGGQGEPWTLADMDNMPELVGHLYGGPGGTHIMMPRCEGEISYCGEAQVAEDVEHLKAALEGDDEAEGFLPAASPGCISMGAENVHYKDYESYLGALVDAMKVEYKAIVDGGLILQLDCPDIPMMPHTHGWISPYVEEIGFARYIELHLDALNAAVADLPPERVRMHLCWGNYGGPHTMDVPVEEVLVPALKARPGAISFEGANPRHEHEWRTLAELDIPEDKLLLPGVIDTKTNVVEHPELVAQRIERYAEVLGRDKIIPGTDCGFGTFVGFGIEPEVAWLKLQALGEGAKIASERLWSNTSASV